ncbi:MAG: DUF4458 domain-containing protein [Alistipes sp.]|nr:DUF4458 domain-containing protein [Alistipes sp.]
MNRLLLILSALIIALGCTKSEPDYRNDDYGFAQFKLYKQASYGTRAVKPTLDYLAEACKVKVTLGYGETTLAQTLTLYSVEGGAEFGLRSDKLQLLTGEYRLVAFSLYDTADELIYAGTPEAESVFTVTSGGLTVHDITVKVAQRGSARFTLKKAKEDFSNAPTRAVARQYTFDEIKYVTLTVGQVLQSGSVTNPIKIEKLPAKFSMHFDEDNQMSSVEGYRTSTVACDSLVSLPAAKYRVVAYETYDSGKNLLESNASPKLSEFTVEDNKTTEADVRVTLYQSDEYLKDYYALYEIWKSLDGENWSYVGENFPRGANWEFNKDPDLWGDQPGVQLHSNGRVAKIDISGFAFRGDLSPAIGQLTELIELYLGTHNDTNLISYDPTLDSSKSLSERNRTRLQSHGEYLRIIHPATQFAEPCARALAENNIHIAATSLYDTMSEQDIIDRKSGAQRIRKMDTNHGTMCNGLRSLPAEIGKLTKLQYLFIANGALETLPEEVGDLVSCTDFELYNCSKLKTFPLQIARMPELVSINISNNSQWSAEQIYAGMDAIARGASKEKIQILYARQNSLEELPESFKNMTKISLLDLAYNKISKVHPLGKNVSPVQLYLDNNLLETLPADSEGYFCGYADSEAFSVRYNRLKKVPNIFSAKSSSPLTSVDFSGNDIDGFEGEENGTYRGIKVETLTLAQNPKLTKYPKALATTNSTVAYIILRGCNIDQIPEGSFEYENSIYLNSLDLSYNNLTDLPREMHAVNLPYLYGVELSFNNFEHFPFEPLDSSYLTVFAIRSQRNSAGERCLREWPEGIFNHKGLRGLYLGSNDLRKIEDTISTLIYYLDISDNPNIIFDATDICYAWQAGAYILIYDKSQTILNCDAMLE